MSAHAIAVAGPSEGPVFDKAAVIGLGHIGSSFARALRAKGGARAVVGLDASKRARETVRSLGIVDAVLPSPETLGRVDLVALAVPVSATERVFSDIAPRLRDRTLVTDLGSVKACVPHLVERLPQPEYFVPGHPIAGTQHSGPQSGDAHLFEGNPVVLAPTERTDPEAVDRVEKMWERLGARPTRLSPEEHDRVFALVSHLPHAAAYALSAAIDACAPSMKDKQELGRWGNGSLLDTTRVAASDPALWSGIFLENRKQLLPALAKLGRAVGEIESALEAGDASALDAVLRRGRRARNALQGKPKSDAS